MTISDTVARGAAGGGAGSTGPVRVRFAPSPTGRLHIGNIRTAVLNWLWALKAGGHILLRLDDTDVMRSTDAFADGIRADLAWLGLNWDEEARQSARTARYNAAANDLKARGLLYPCFETPDELDRRRKRQLAMHRPPIYDRAALKLTADDIAARVAKGDPVHWRFRLPNTASSEDVVPRSTPIAWADTIRGDQHVDLGSLSDPVLIRADGSYLYTFTSVIDDIDFAISHVVRGEDHVTNTGVQLALFDAFGAPPPVFGHHSLLVAADGSALSKRLGALSIESLREAGLEPMAVVSHAALIGTSDAIEPMASIATLADAFAFDKISTAPARFAQDDLFAINAKYLHHMPYAEAAPRLAALGISGDEAFWLAVRGNLKTLNDVHMWWHVIADEVKPVVEDAAFLQTAADLLPLEPWGDETWSAWTKALKAATGVKGRALFHPLRLALTGQESGPELKDLLPLIGREKVRARLTGETA